MRESQRRRQDLEQRRQELASFLKSRRARLSPAALGLAVEGRRRVQGLRREEVVQLAGGGVISLDWYTALEQGRPDANPSAEMLDHLARALRLSAAEAEYLFRLADRPLPALPSPREADLGEDVARLLTRLDPWPALVLGARWDVLAWNRACSAVFGDFGAVPTEERNAVWLVFTSPALRALIDEWERHARRVLAQFRAGAGRYPGDPWFQELVDRTLAASASFRAWWPAQDVRHRARDELRVNHPVAGALAFAQMVLDIKDAPGCELVIYSPLPEHDTADRLARLVADVPPDASITLARP